MRRAFAVVALLATLSCSHKTVGRTVASASPSASAAESPSASPEQTKGPQPSATVVTPQPTATYTAASGIDGQVTAGPTCPVERVGHPCPPRPVTDATVTARGPQTKSAHTDGNGKFSLTLSPGTYDVSASSKSSFSCASQHVQVAAHRYTHIAINCDTGMR